MPASGHHRNWHNCLLEPTYMYSESIGECNNHNGGWWCKGRYENVCISLHVVCVRGRG